MDILPSLSPQTTTDCSRICFAFTQLGHHSIPLVPWLEARTSHTIFNEIVLLEGAPDLLASLELSPNLVPLLEPGDILIDGGNSYYIDDNDVDRGEKFVREEILPALAQILEQRPLVFQ